MGGYVGILAIGIIEVIIGIIEVIVFAGIAITGSIKNKRSANVKD